MDAMYSNDFPHAFVVGQEELTKFTKLLNDGVGEVTITVRCADDVTRTFSSVDELLAYENPKAKQIRRLHIQAHSNDHTKRASVELASIWLRGIAVEIQGPDEVVSRLREKVLDIINGMIPWYSLLTRVNFAFVLLGCYLLLWFGSLAAVAFLWVPVREP